MSSDSPTSGPGLVISTTKPIFSFLISASTDPQLSKELQQTASNLSSKPNVPYNSTSRSELSGPKPKEKSEELEARLEKLAEMSERNAYAELVKDVTPRKDINSLSLFTRINWGLIYMLW
ncbi:hypothetical protein M0R45_019784 [Rubus argutus]|uniref:Uncharacterized protein n=1 Tax=Rubus argutus TaxID=59490 RepID=A0AAW1X6E1_RUBAR